MYRRPKFLETLLEIREQMAAEADYDVDLFAEMVRQGSASDRGRLARSSAPVTEEKKPQPARKKTRRDPVAK